MYFLLVGQTSAKRTPSKLQSSREHDLSRRRVQCVRVRRNLGVGVGPEHLHLQFEFHDFKVCLVVVIQFFDEMFRAATSASRLKGIMQTLRFQGLTGCVRFENNERLGLVDVLQLRDSVYTKIGYFDSAENASFLQRLSSQFCLMFDLETQNNVQIGQFHSTPPL